MGTDEISTPGVSHRSPREPGVFSVLVLLMRDDLNAREQKTRLCGLGSCVVALTVWG